MRRIAVVLTAGISLLLAACKPETPPPQNSEPQKFEITDVAVGTGKEATTGGLAVVHYTGWLFDASAANHQGKKFDSSRDRADPFRFPLGAGQVIKGWDQGVVGMKVGGQRRLVIPPDMGYGARGAGDAIPPNATLLFDVELLAVE